MKINFRPFLFIFFCTVCGILFSLVTYYILPLGIIFLSLFGLSVIIFGIYSFVKKDHVKAVSAVIAIVVVLCCSLTFLLVSESRADIKYEEEHTIKGRVTEHCSYTDGVFEAVLDNIEIDENAEDGKISAYIYNADLSFSQVRTGYTLEFVATVYDKPPIDDNGVNASFVRSDIRYAAYSYGGVTVTPGNGTFLEKIRLGLRDHLVENMGDDAGLVAYGMIAGDRYLISDEINDAFAGAGIGHILAVSGLHVGLIFLLINKLFSFIPMPKIVGRFATTLLLILYAIFTGGSPSTIRAVIMCFIMIWSSMFGKRDNLNSLLLAATVCLCISPFYLFDCGYLMSVGAVGGIILFSKSISNALRKIKLPGMVSDSLSASVSVQLIITPVIAYFFHRVYLYSMPVNGVGMWLLSGLFFLLVAILPFSFLLPVLLVPVGYLIRGMIFVCNGITMLPLASSIIQVGAAVFIIPVILFAASEYVYVNGKKYLTVIELFLSIVIGFSSDVTIRISDCLVVVGGNTFTTVIYNGNERYLFADFYDGRAVSSALDNAKVGNESFIIYEYALTEEIAEEIVEFSRRRSVIEVRYVYYPAIGGLQKLQENEIPAFEVFLADEDLTLATSNGTPCGWLYTSNGTTAFIGRTQSYTSALVAADIMRVKYAPYSEYYPEKLFLPSRGDRADNVTVTSYGNSYYYNFKTKVLKAV